MTLIIGKQCDNGVMLVADSASIASTGGVTNSGVKALHGLSAGSPFAAVFAGYGGNVGGPHTIDVIRDATCSRFASLQEDIKNAVQGRLIDEVRNGNWTDDAGVVDQAARDHFEDNEHVTFFLSLRADEWWCVDVTAKVQNYFSRVLPGHMAIIQPGPNTTAFDELKGLRDHGPQTLRQAAQTMGGLFQRAIELFPNEVRYPGTVLLHLSGGVSEASFSNSAELMAAVSRSAP